METDRAAGELSQQCVALTRASTSVQRRRKRPRLPEAERQRAVIACDRCRRLKEKCDGGAQCARCQRCGRPCERSPSNGRPDAAGRMSDSTHQRLTNLEHIAKHFLGDAALASETLQASVDALVAGQGLPDSNKDRPSQDRELAMEEPHYTIKEVSPNVAHYSGEFSHWSFSKRIQDHVDRGLQTSTAGTSKDDDGVIEYWRANHLRSSKGTVQSTLCDLPPKDISMFLLKTYFCHAQTNTPFVEEGWANVNLERLYTSLPTICEDDAPCVCTLLLVLAVGTQFAHLEDKPLSAESSLAGSIDHETAVESVGVALYQRATRLIPDVLTIASVESVQAFLLFAHYVLPLDAQGLAYSYVGMATKVAIQNGMHRHCKDSRLDALALSFRTKLWMTASRLEKRISVLHGRPETITSLESTINHLDSVVGASNHDMNRRQMTMLQLTDWLSRINCAIEAIHSNSGSQRALSFEDLFESYQQHQKWWQSLSDMATLAASPSRAMIHVHLCYHLNVVFLGRPFVFTHAKRHGVSSHTAPHRGLETTNGLQSKSQTLARAAVQSARAIVDLCQMLHGSLGLARASYTEFSSCRAAIMTLLAHDLDTFTADDINQAPHAPVNESLAQGMALIRLMASANVSAQSEVSVLTSLDDAIKRLASKRGSDNSTRPDATSETIRPYDNLASWALGLRNHACDLQSSQLTSSHHVEPFHYDHTAASEWPSASEMWDGEAQSLLNVDDIFDFAMP
jgi:hypothetical protein